MDDIVGMENLVGIIIIVTCASGLLMCGYFAYRYRHVSRVCKYNILEEFSARCCRCSKKKKCMDLDVNY